MWPRRRAGWFRPRLRLLQVRSSGSTVVWFADNYAHANLCETSIGRNRSALMRSTRKVKGLQLGLFALVLPILVYFAWQHYHQPGPRIYEGKTLDQWIEDLDDPDYSVSERAANILAGAGREAVPALIEACERGGIRL